MLPDYGGICMGVDSRNHQFAPGLPPGWVEGLGSGVQGLGFVFEGFGSACLGLLFGRT